MDRPVATRGTGDLWGLVATCPHKRGQPGNLELPTEDGALPRAELLGAGRGQRGLFVTSCKPACAHQRPKPHTQLLPGLGSPSCPPHFSDTNRILWAHPLPQLKLVEPSCGGDWGQPLHSPLHLSAAFRLGNSLGERVAS